MSKPTKTELWVTLTSMAGVALAPRLGVPPEHLTEVIYSLTAGRW